LIEKLSINQLIFCQLIFNNTPFGEKVPQLATNDGQKYDIWRQSFTVATDEHLSE
jgi:hypothetical protein